MTITSTSDAVVTPWPISSNGAISLPPATESTYYPGVQWLPTTLITEAPPTAAPSSVTQPTTTTTTAGGALPNVIAPSGGIPTIPSDSTLVQVGFTYALNYPFIVRNPLAVAQIFDYLPKGISYGLDISINQTIMQSIQPYETAGESFIVSVAMMYIPNELVNTLLLGLHTPSSQFYDNPDPSVNSLMGLIDPTIPLVAATGDNGSTAVPGDSSSESSGSSSNGGNGDSSGATGNNQSTVLSGSLDSSESPTKSSKQVIGIAVGAVAGVVLYGALVFIVARKYRQRKQRQSTTPNMRQISPPMPYIATSSSSPYLYGSVPGSGRSGTGGAGGGLGDGQLGHSPTSSTGQNNNASRQSRVSGSHGSSSGGYVSARNQPISVPVMSENSLGWS
ncbi:hypothetical protein LIPSTDRAFT_172049 [Lipomyces starkeyi NRRL Y-11557]|uniref:Signaling mucin MSB2 n=1 Tax=Lipomyces starkeyi NRRL Y-11557 TaxID=675824 RepID=A0A1E3PYX5_LIPST|nr:hypothetical protein LIPSTDRAFT_172049 [Lipomyces starkeyi NRRL Y-11557]